MTIEEAIFARLSNFTGLTDLVGSRIFPIHAEQGDAMPFVTYQRISTNYVSAMGADIPDVNARFQFDAIAESRSQARAVITQVRAALQRYQGGGIVDAFILNENDFYDDEPILYRSQIDFKIHY